MHVIRLTIYSVFSEYFLDVQSAWISWIISTCWMSGTDRLIRALEYPPSGGLNKISFSHSYIWYLTCISPCYQSGSLYLIYLYVKISGTHPGDWQYNKEEWSYEYHGNTEEYVSKVELLQYNAYVPVDTRTKLWKKLKLTNSF